MNFEIRKANFKASSLLKDKYHDKKLTENLHYQKSQRSMIAMAKRGVSPLNIVMSDSGGLTQESIERILTQLQSHPNPDTEQFVRGLTYFVSNNTERILAILQFVPLLYSVWVQADSSWPLRIGIAELFSIIGNENHDCCMVVHNQGNVMTVSEQYIRNAAINAPHDIDITHFLRCIGAEFRWLAIDSFEVDTLQSISTTLLHAISIQSSNVIIIEEALWCFVYLSVKLPEGHVFCPTSPLWPTLIQIAQFFERDPASILPIFVPLSRILSNICGSRVLDPTQFFETVLPIVGTISQIYWRASDIDLGEGNSKLLDQAVWRLWVSTLEEFACYDKKTAISNGQDPVEQLQRVLLQGIVTDAISGDIAHFLSRATVLSHRFRSDYTLMKSIVHFMFNLTQTTHQLGQMMSLLSHGSSYTQLVALQSQLRYWLVNNSIGQDDAVPLLLFLDGLRTKMSDNEYLFYAFHLCLFCFGDAEAKRILIGKIIEQDLAEDIENVQYGCGSEEVADLAAALLDEVYAVMENEDM